jgi:hypothetical protein
MISAGRTRLSRFWRLAALLLWRFFSTHGLAMLRMMKRPMPEDGQGAGAGDAHA